MTTAEEPRSETTAPVSDDEARSHPIFDRINAMPRGVVSAIAERRIADGQADGFFDDLPGHGKPIADLDRPRPAGWWAERFVAKERHGLAREDLLASVRRAMPGIWRLTDAEAVRSSIERLNEDITEHNRVTSIEPVPPLDPAETIATWRRLRGE